jgi:hypothetical protein
VKLLNLYTGNLRKLLTNTCTDFHIPDPCKGHKILCGLLNSYSGFNLEIMLDFSTLPACLIIENWVKTTIFLSLLIFSVHIKQL